MAILAGLLLEDFTIVLEFAYHWGACGEAARCNNAGKIPFVFFSDHLFAEQREIDTE